MTDDERPWRLLYRLGAAAALTVLVLVPVQVVVFVVWPPPTTVEAWLALFTERPLLGLLDMDLLLVVDQVLTTVVLVALAVALRRERPSFLVVAVALELLAASAYVSSNTAFSFLALARDHAAAVSDADRAAVLAAGHALLATYVGTAFDVGYVLGGLALLCLVPPLWSTRRLAVLTLAMAVPMLVPPTVGPVGLVLSLVSLVPLIPWLALVAHRLWRTEDVSRGRASGSPS